MTNDLDKAKVIEELRAPVFDVSDWDFIAGYGTSAWIYAKGDERVLVNRETGRLILRFTK